jgi:hypothetical protein
MSDPKENEWVDTDPLYLPGMEEAERRFLSLTIRKDGSEPPPDLEDFFPAGTLTVEPQHATAIEREADLVAAVLNLFHIQPGTMVPQIVAYQEFLEALPSDSEAAAKGFARHAAFFLKEGEIPLAVEAVTQSLKRHVTGLGELVRAEINRLNGQSRLAMEGYERAVQLDPALGPLVEESIRKTRTDQTAI